MASKKKFAAKSANKSVTASKQIKATNRVLRDAFGRFIKQIKESQRDVKKTQKNLQRSTREVKKQSKQVVKTSKSLKQLSITLRDAFGRFASPASLQKQAPKQSTVKKTSKNQTPQKQASKKTPKKQVTPSATQKTPTQKSFSFRAMRPKNGESMEEWYLRLEENAAEYDKLKEKSDFWSFEYMGGKSKRLYSNLQLAVQAQSRYDLSKRIMHGSLEGDEETEEEVLQSIKFMRMKGGAGVAKSYSDKRIEQIEKRKKEREVIREDARQLLKQSGKPVGKYPGPNVDLVKQLTDRIKELEQGSNASKQKQNKEPSKSRVAKKQSKKKKA